MDQDYGKGGIPRSITSHHVPCFIHRASVLPKQFLWLGLQSWTGHHSDTGILNLGILQAIAHLLFAKNTLIF